MTAHFPWWPTEEQQWWKGFFLLQPIISLIYRNEDNVDLFALCRNYPDSLVLSLPLLHSLPSFHFFKWDHTLFNMNSLLNHKFKSSHFPTWIWVSFVIAEGKGKVNWASCKHAIYLYYYILPSWLQLSSWACHWIRTKKARFSCCITK